MRLQNILTYARIKPAVHQIEVHPVWTNQYNIDFCHKEVIILLPRWHYLTGVLDSCYVAGATSLQDSMHRPMSPFLSAAHRSHEQALTLFSCHSAEVLCVAPCVSAACLVQGIHVTAYSPLGSPDSAEMMKRQHKQSVMDNPTVKEVASKHNKAAAEVSTLHLKWTVYMCMHVCIARFQLDSKVRMG